MGECEWQGRECEWQERAKRDCGDWEYDIREQIVSFILFNKAQKDALVVTCIFAGESRVENRGRISGQCLVALTQASTSPY